MYIVPEVGLEPTSLAALDFESSMFANFITLAYYYSSSLLNLAGKSIVR